MAIMYKLLYFLEGGKLLGVIFFTLASYGRYLQAGEKNGPDVRNYMFKVLEMWAYCWTLPN
jgi:hypothetical protein